MCLNKHILKISMAITDISSFCNLFSSCAFFQEKPWSNLNQTRIYVCNSGRDDNLLYEYLDFVAGYINTMNKIKLNHTY